MNIRENIRIAAYSIKTNLMRSLLTMLGIIIGVSSVIAIITVGNGGRDFIVGMIRDMGQNMVTIQVDHQRADASQHITRRNINSIRAMDHVVHVSPQLISFGATATHDFDGLALGLGGNADLQHIIGFDVTHGRFFTEAEYNSAASVVLIPLVGAMSVFGTPNVVGRHINYTISGQTTRLRIIGVVEMNLGGDMFGGGDADAQADMMESLGLGGMGEGMMMMFLPSTLIHQMQGRSGATYDNISIIADDERNLDLVGNAAANYLYMTHGNMGSGAYRVMNMATYIDLLDSVITILTTFIAGVSGISLVVGGIGVMNIMLVSVTERTREIGIRKALGAKTGTILFQFLTESVILCLIGGIIGFIIGVAAAAFVAFWMGIPIAMRMGTIAIAVGFSSAIGIFFGIYPARRAAKMLPIDALRRE